ncbi:MAG TPA: hypothetical protein VEY93_09730, partial [Longimicrobium sp.]|nr:hypothetical protein [Longimicrobium sp.]
MSADAARTEPTARSRRNGWWARLRRQAAWAALALCFAGSVAPAGAQDALAARAAAPAASTAWDGSPRVLQVNEYATLGQTPAGSAVFWYLNATTQNNLGELGLTWGGAAPVFLQAEALATQPGFLVGHWRANDLRVTNVSANNATPIRIRALGPG